MQMFDECTIFDEKIREIGKVKSSFACLSTKSKRTPKVIDKVIVTKPFCCKVCV